MNVPFNSFQGDVPKREREMRNMNLLSSHLRFSYSVFHQVNNSCLLDYLRGSKE